MDKEKVVFMENDAVMMDFTKENATSILCQAMFDETIRLRKCFWRKERDSIRKFLIESFQIISANNPDKQHQEGLPDDMQPELK